MTEKTKLSILGPLLSPFVPTQQHSAQNLECRIKDENDCHYLPFERAYWISYAETQRSHRMDSVSEETITCVFPAFDRFDIPELDRSRTHDTPSHGSGHLCQIRKESIQNVRFVKRTRQDVTYFNSLLLKRHKNIYQGRMSDAILGSFVSNMKTIHPELNVL